MSSQRVRLLGAAALLVFGCETAFAQAVAGGQIRGVVTDPSGANITGAQITAEQTGSGYRRTAITASDGTYVLPDLPVGPYSLRASLKGFSNYTQSGIVIQVGDNLQVNVTLKVGDVSEHMEVAATAQMVQTEDTSVSEVVDQNRIVDLPLNGRLRNLNTRQWLNSSSFAANAPGTIGNAGSLSVVGPGYFDIDLSLSRSFRIVENQRLTVRAEFFNILNHTNFMAPTNSLVSSNFGVILSANDPRILQFSMKYTF
jgi:Carboxypeptidase regulatory-like domain